MGHRFHPGVHQQPRSISRGTVCLLLIHLSFRYLPRCSYPNDNCNAEYGIGSPVNVQDIFPAYLNHTAGINIIQPYLNSTAIAQAAGKPFLMFETNTASCGGFPGLSDSFGAAMWLLDYGLQMAYSNFSGALLHVSGEDVYYDVSVCACHS